MQIFFMFLWCFVLRVIPFKKVLTAIVCMVVLISGTIVINNFNMRLENSDTFIFVKDK